MLSQNTSLGTEIISDWDQVCLIGLGKHSINKLLPNLERKYAGNISVVSSKKNNLELINKSFSSLDNALKELKNNTLYVVATPPATHFSLSKKLLNMGKDVLVEKPSFLKINHFNVLKELAITKKLVLAEMMMYLENKIVKKSTKIIKDNIDNLKEINITFTIPSNPENTFRNENAFENSVIADIGCYPLNFLSYLDLPLEKLILRKPKNKNPKFPIYEIENINKPKIYISFGCSGTYKNSMKVEFINNKSIEVSPFFYGLEGLRDQIIINKKVYKMEKKHENNCFQALFDRSRKNWLENQSVRFNKMEKVIKSFEKFSNDFEQF